MFSSTPIQVKVDLVRFLSEKTLSICRLGPGTDVVDLEKEQFRTEQLIYYKQVYVSLAIDLLISTFAHC